MKLVLVVGSQKEQAVCGTGQKEASSCPFHLL
jgi:hypothetical protein